MNGMSEIQRAAEETIREWVTQKERMSVTGPEDPTTHLRKIIVKGMLGELEDLRVRVAAAERLATNLGADMLYTLEAALLGDDDEDPDPARALVYLVRGWRRDHDLIALADTTEGRAVDAAIADLPDAS